MITTKQLIQIKKLMIKYANERFVSNDTRLSDYFKVKMLNCFTYQGNTIDDQNTIIELLKTVDTNIDEEKSKKTYKEEKEKAVKQLEFQNSLKTMIIAKNKILVENEQLIKKQNILKEQYNSMKKFHVFKRLSLMREINRLNLQIESKSAKLSQIDSHIMEQGNGISISKLPQTDFIVSQLKSLTTGEAPKISVVKSEDDLSITPSDKEPIGYVPNDRNTKIIPAILDDQTISIIIKNSNSNLIRQIRQKKLNIGSMYTDMAKPVNYHRVRKSLYDQTGDECYQTLFPQQHLVRER